jgi:hypothetical protein
MDVRAEMNKELRRARGWLLAVGIVMFVVSLIQIYADRSTADLDPTAKHIAAAIMGVILIAFLALWWFAKRKPKLCLSLGLALYWGLQIWNAFYDPATIYQGIVLKFLFTAALVKGIASAGRVEVLREQVVKVFE